MKYDVTVPSGLGEFTSAASPPPLSKKHRGKFDGGVFEEEDEDEDEEDEKAHLMIGNVRVDFDAKEEKRKSRNEIYWEYDNGDTVGGDDSDEEEEEETEEEDEDSDSYSSSISDEEEYDRQLKAIAGMALDGDTGGGSHMVPSPGSSFGESSSSSDDWTSKKGRQKAIAKKRKAKRAAQEQLIEEEELETYVESVLETLMYLGEGSYIGLPPGMTKMKLECVRDIVNQRSRGSLGFLFETVGGGKRIHAVIRFHGNSSAAKRSVMSYYGKESRDKKGKNRRNTQQRGSTRKAATPVSFIKAGEATDLTRVESSSDDDEDTSGEPKVYANRGLRRAAEAEAKAKALRRARKKASKGVPVDSGRNYADFEKYGNGIGSKLMEKMGFTHGTGLGAKRDGKAEPVEAVMRKKRAGLGT